MGLTRREMAMLAAAAALSPAVAKAGQWAPLIFFDADGAPARAAYERAISRGADFLAAPVAMSQDGALVAVPDIELSSFTDVASRPEFAARRTDKAVDGASVSGWFCDDFTLAEIETLATGPAIKTDHGAVAPSVLSLQTVIDIARAGSVRLAKVVGVSPRMVRPDHFAGGDLAMEPALARLIAVNGYDSPAAAMIVQASDAATLRALGAICRARRAQRVIAGDIDLAQARGGAEALAPPEAAVIDGASKGPMSATPLIAAAHSAGLAVYPRLRAAVAHEPHDTHDRLAALFLAGADGVMCDDVALAARARREAMDKRRGASQS